MNFKDIDKNVIAGLATALAACVIITTVPWNFTSTGSAENTMPGEYNSVVNSAGANSSILSGEGSNSAGVNGAISGDSVGVVDVGNGVVGQPSDENADNEKDETTDGGDAAEPSKPVYNTFGYTNLGLADVNGNLNVRQKATTSSKVVGKLTKYAACEILEETSGWYKIKSGNVEGYVSAEYIITGEKALILAQTEARNVATVTTGSLRVRQAPSTDSKKLANVAKGEELIVVEVLDGWVKVEFPSYDEAYVSTDYVKVECKLKTGNTMAELRYGDGVSSVRVELVNYALQFVGNPYVWAGTSLTKGVDCSGFTMQIFKKYGVKLPHYSGSQPKYGTKIKASKAQPGDLFFYGDNGKINHVAIYIGNGKIVHAASPKQGIIISNAFYSTPICVVSYFK